MVLKRVQMGCGVLKIITHCPPDMLLVRISSDAKNKTDMWRIVSPYFLLNVKRLLAREAELALPKARLATRSLTGHRR